MSGAATVSINTSGSLGAASRLRRRAGRGVERCEVVSSIWSTGTVAAEAAVSMPEEVWAGVACIGVVAGINTASADTIVTGAGACSCATLGAASTGTRAGA